jgi:DeoR/GlpR family transcriptional regulator of sugar metabolism
MTERAELFPVSLPTVSKDLKELERAGLLARSSAA